MSRYRILPFSALIFRLRLRNAHLPVENNGGASENEEPCAEKDDYADENGGVHTHCLLRDDL